MAELRNGRPEARGRKALGFDASVFQRVAPDRCVSRTRSPLCIHDPGLNVE